MSPTHSLSLARGARVLVAALGLLGAGGCGEPPPTTTTTDAGADAGPVHTPRPFAATDATRAYCVGADDEAVEARITAWLAALSLDEKVALMHGAEGGLVDGTWTVEGVPRLGIPGLHMLDGPRGVSAFSGLSATAFPVAALRGATFDPALERRVGLAMAREARAAGADVLLAPTMNVLRHPRWGRAQETYSEDVHHLGAMALALVEGVQSGHVIASAKHLAANSLEDRRHSVDVQLDERTLREIYLPHFRRVVVEGHVGSVMSAYNRVNGLYCDLNTHLLREILKDEWGFSGFVVSDWYLGTHGDAASVEAGLDVEMPSASRFRRLPAAVRSGALDEDAIDDAVRRVLRAALCAGLDAAPAVRDPSGLEAPAQRALAREVATRGIVLLKNAESALPFGPEVRRIALLGRLADVENIGDRGSSAVRSTDVVTAHEGLAMRAGLAVDLVPTLDADGEARVRAADAVVVVTGLDADDEGEGDIGAGDRASLALPDAERALILRAAALHPRVVVVLEAGSALLTGDFEDEVEALLFAFYPGVQGGHALADLLFGDAAPSGRLPFSIPAREGDLPSFDASDDTIEYGFLHGYRHLAANGTPPQHAFGEGLTYTTFRYDALALASDALPRDGRIEARVTVTNTGAREGTETVQLYVAALGSRVPRAPDDLRAFAQITLAAGATGTVTLRVPAPDLAFWDEAAHAFEVEAIEYEVRVGPHAGEARQTARVRVR